MWFLLTSTPALSCDQPLCAVVMHYQEESGEDGPELHDESHTETRRVGEPLVFQLWALQSEPVLTFVAGEGVTLEVAARERRSVYLSDSGPTYRLPPWHAWTAFSPLKESTAGWAVPTGAMPQLAPVPVDALVRSARALDEEGETRLADLAARCPSMSEDPCMLQNDLVEVRVTALRGGKVLEVRTVLIHLPTSC